MSSAPSVRKARACASSFGSCRAARPGGRCAPPCFVRRTIRSTRQTPATRHHQSRNRRGDAALGVDAGLLLAVAVVRRSRVHRRAAAASRSRGDGRATFGIDRDLRASRSLCVGNGRSGRHRRRRQLYDGQPFAAPDGVIVVGISTGGWASLAIAARNLPQVEAVVNFAGGRGGHAYGQPNAVCGTEELLSAAALTEQRALLRPSGITPRTTPISDPGWRKAWRRSGAAPAAASKSICCRPMASRAIPSPTTAPAGTSGDRACRAF